MTFSWLQVVGGRSNYLFLMVILCQLMIASFPESYTPARRKNGKTEEQKRQASQVFSFKEFSWKFHTVTSACISLAETVPWLPNV